MMIRVLLLSTLIAAPALAADTGSRDCVALRSITSQRIVPGAILFRTGGKWYRNEMSSACPILKPNRAIQTRTTTSQLCAGDLVNVFENPPNFSYGACALGTFEPIAAPPPAGRRGSR